MMIQLTANLEGNGMLEKKTDTKEIEKEVIMVEEVVVVEETSGEIVEDPMTDLETEITESEKKEKGIRILIMLCLEVIVTFRFLDND
mmetsp:Transcript_25302/g.35450  ORF Transcript_25302/g.35450 Transcript_25302/m.35450 type:complete len:87 (+) Transcript_25302:216-476(+)